MADTLRIKRRTSGAPGAPATLANAEIAYNEVDNTLYYGFGGTAAAAASVVPIGGAGQGSNAAPLMDGVAAPGTATQWSRGDHRHPSDTSRAPLASPALTGTPTTPTAAPGTNTTQIATTAFVTGALPPAGAAAPLMDGAATAGAATPYSREDHIHPIDTSRAPLASPALTGTPTAPTVAPGTDSSTKLATTAFVQSAISAVSAGVTNITVSDGLSGGGTGVVNIGITANGVANASLAQMAPHTYKGNNTGSAATPIDVSAALLLNDIGAAPLASPVFTGDPQAPTPAPGDNDTSIATTAFVTAALATAGTPSNANPLMDGVAAPGTGTPYSREDHVHPTDTTRAPLASPTFTGTPNAPTAANGTNTTQLATTAFVLAQRLDQHAPPTAAINFNGQSAIGLANPVNPQDGTTKFYVDAAIQGLSAKETARVATTADLGATYANGTAGVGATLTAGAALTIDGVAIAAGDVVLVKNQTTAAQNGLYTATSTTVLTRHVDMDQPAEFAGAFVAVEQGTAGANSLWLANPVGAVTVGTTAIPWTQLNAATSYVAGNGINIAANTVSAVGVANRISVGPPGIDIAATYVGQASITTLGTITAGTWNGTVVDVAHGGSGAATLTGYVKGNGTAAMTASATIPTTDITGLGTMAFQDATAVAITGGTVDGIIFDMGVF